MMMSRQPSWIVGKQHNIYFFYYGLSILLISIDSVSSKKKVTLQNIFLPLNKLWMETTDGKENVRLFEVDDKADEVSVVRRSVPLPGQFNPCATGTV